MISEEFSLQTSKKYCFICINSFVESFLQKHPDVDGLLNIFASHTTGGLTINENVDPNVASDLERAFQAIPPPLKYSHLEGNTPAHVVSSIVGCSLVIPVSKGKLLMGSWQGIFFVEFDGPRQRKIRLSLLKSV